MVTQEFTLSKKLILEYIACSDLGTRFSNDSTRTTIDAVKLSLKSVKNENSLKKTKQ